MKHFQKFPHLNFKIIACFVQFFSNICFFGPHFCWWRSPFDSTWGLHFDKLRFTSYVATVVVIYKKNDIGFKTNFRSCLFVVVLCSWCIRNVHVLPVLSSPAAARWWSADCGSLFETFPKISFFASLTVAKHWYMLHFLQRAVIRSSCQLGQM